MLHISALTLPILMFSPEHKEVCIFSHCLSFCLPFMYVQKHPDVTASPQAETLFHFPPEEAESIEDMSAYEEADWELYVQHMWFWGFMNRGDCEKKLYNEGETGDFVIRLNANQQLVMSLWYVIQLLVL